MIDYPINGSEASYYSNAKGERQRITYTISHTQKYIPDFTYVKGISSKLKKKREETIIMLGAEEAFFFSLNKTMQHKKK